MEDAGPVFTSRALRARVQVPYHLDYVSAHSCSDIRIHIGSALFDCSCCYARDPRCNPTCVRIYLTHADIPKVTQVYIVC